MPYITSIEQLGREAGLEQGREEGLEKGLERGRQEGQLLAVREYILDLLESRLGGVPYEVRERVNAETDLARLKSWHRTAGTCSRIEDFQMS